MNGCALPAEEQPALVVDFASDPKRLAYIKAASGEKRYVTNRFVTCLVEEFRRLEAFPEPKNRFANFLERQRVRQLSYDFMTTITKLINEDADVDVWIEDLERDPLKLALEWKNEQMARLLLLHGAQPTARHLFYVCEANFFPNFELCKLFLEKGASLDRPFEYNFNKQHDLLARQSTILHDLKKYTYVVITDQYTVGLFNFTVICDPDTEELVVASTDNNSARVFLNLTKHEESFEEAKKYLDEYYFDGCYEESALSGLLSHQTSTGYEGSVERRIEKGVRVNESYRLQFMADHVKAFKCFSECGSMYNVARANNHHLIKVLVEQGGANIMREYKGDNLLHRTAGCSDPVGDKGVGTIKFLLAHGACWLMTKLNACGQTPLECALCDAWHPYRTPGEILPMVELLIKSAIIFPAFDFASPEEVLSGEQEMIAYRRILAVLSCFSDIEKKINRKMPTDLKLLLLFHSKERTNDLAHLFRKPIERLLTAAMKSAYYKNCTSNSSHQLAALEKRRVPVCLRTFFARMLTFSTIEWLHTEIARIWRKHACEEPILSLTDERIASLLNRETLKERFEQHTMNNIQELFGIEKI